VRPKEEIPTEAQSMSRLLLQGTFGPTKAAVAEALKAAGVAAGGTADDANTKPAEAWIAAQMALKESLHRAYGRARTNPRFWRRILGRPLGAVRAWLALEQIRV